MAVCGSQLLATCSDDGSVRVWSIKEREQTLHFQVMHQSCHCLAFAAPQPKKTKKHKTDPDTDQKDTDSKTNDNVTSSLSDLKFPSLAAGYSDGTIRMFDLNKVEMNMKIQPHASAVTALCYASDGAFLMTLTSVTFTSCRL